MMLRGHLLITQGPCLASHTGSEDAGQKAASVSNFVGAALGSSARAPLGEAETTLAQGIDHPSAELRLQASNF